MTSAEQVAILDAELDQGTGEFDDLILEERGHIRRTAKGREGEEDLPESMEDYGGGGGGSGNSEYGGAVGTGGGMMPNSSGGPPMPQQAAKYPPPADIPNGNDDDVVARQLREAAMREPDPKLREKLWDEYRKYKGIDK